MMLPEHKRLMQDLANNVHKNLDAIGRFSEDNEVAKLRRAIRAVQEQIKMLAKHV